MATNFSYTPVLNVHEIQDKILAGVSIRFMVLNPYSKLLNYIAKDFLIESAQLSLECHHHLKTLYDLRVFAEKAGGSGRRVGKVEIRLYDTAPRMRAYIFDGEEGTSFFVPYGNYAYSRPLPVYYCLNSYKISQTYIKGLENLWNDGETETIEELLVDHPDVFLF